VVETNEFELAEGERLAEGPALVVDVGGFEGPLDLLLALARAQQVDLSKISILALANQYLEFIDRARDLKIEVAADYLVMAAWLAYLKSRLLLPEPQMDEEPSAADLAADLAQRLQHLETIRQAGARLMTRHRLGHDFFGRGMPEMRGMPRRTVWSLAEARESLFRLVGVAGDWTNIDQYLLQYIVEPAMRATVFASSFSASLEMVREGAIEIQQEAAFTPIWLRRRSSEQRQNGEKNS
jgi:segregation and condensation protein A